MINGKIKTIGKKTLIYILFLVSVMAWMIVLGPKKTLTANEELYVQEFIAQIESEPVAPTQMASETPILSNIQYGTINENSVRVRSGPGLDFPVVQQLFKGNEVELVEEIVGGWWKIAINGSHFYVSSDYVNVNRLTGLNQ